MRKRKVKVPKKGRVGGMAKGALKKGGGAKFGRGAGVKVDKAAGNSLAPPRGASAPLGEAGTKLGGNRARARDKRLQNAQL